VSSALAVFHSQVPAKDVQPAPAGRLRSLYRLVDPSSPIRRLGHKAKTVFHFLSYKNNIPLRAQLVAKQNYHEDYFWSYEARQYAEDFRIPEPIDALAFSFETAPRYCLTANSGRMPFGCHAWTKYDRSFWEPFLLPPSD
jgi:hypothetical protein